MTKNNTILKSGKLALFYALTTGLLAWVAGCVLVFAWVGLTGIPPISAMFRMFIYHYLYFYLYFAIIAVFYSGWLYCYLLNIRQARKRAFWGLIMICTLSVIPCGVLYEVQDMLHGFYPEYSIFTKLFGHWEDWFFVGYFIILTSLPITIPAVFCFFFVNKKVALLFDKGYKPAIYRKLAKWHQEHPKRFFITVGTVLWVLFFAAVMWSFEFDHETAYWQDLIYIPRGSFNPWLFLGLPFLIGIGMGLSVLLYLLKFISWKLAWAVLLFTVSILSGWAIWENLPQNRFIYALGNAYHKGMRLESLKTFHSFNNSDELIAGKFYSSKEMICDQALKVSPNRAVILKKVGDNIYEFESRFDSGRRQGGNFEKIEKWTVEK